MRRTLLVGALLALATFLLVDHGGHLGLDDTFVVLLGAAVGAVLGLVPDRTPLQRIGGFLAGFVAGVLGYTLRVGLLPDIPMGHALAAALVVVVVTLVAAASRNRLPMWAQLLGAAGYVGSYDGTFTAQPTHFLSDWLGAATTGLLAAAFGFLVAGLAAELTRTSDAEEPGPARAASGQPPAQRAGIEIVQPKTEA